MSETKQPRKGESRKCDCIHYEDDGSGADCCHCGHNVDFHMPTREYPGDRSCKGSR